MKYSVKVGPSVYSPDGGSVPVIVGRALREHEKRAREAKRKGDVVPEPLKSIIRKRGLTIMVLPAVGEMNEEPVKPRRRRTLRGFARQ